MSRKQAQTFIFEPFAALFGGIALTDIIADSLDISTLIEKAGAVGLLAIVLWFILTRLQKSIDGLSDAVNRNTEATHGVQLVVKEKGCRYKEKSGE
jgi:hypothetical protein